MDVSEFARKGPGDFHGEGRGIGESGSYGNYGWGSGDGYGWGDSCGTGFGDGFGSGDDNDCGVGSGVGGVYCVGGGDCAGSSVY